jgi:hypothetical protein
MIFFIIFIKYAIIKLSILQTYNLFQINIRKISITVILGRNIWQNIRMIFVYLRFVNIRARYCLSPLTLCVRAPLRRGVLDITLSVCDKVCQWSDRWFSPVSSTHRTPRYTWNIDQSDVKDHKTKHIQVIHTTVFRWMFISTYQKRDNSIWITPRQLPRRLPRLLQWKIRHWS